MATIMSALVLLFIALTNATMSSMMNTIDDESFGAFQASPRNEKVTGSDFQCVVNKSTEIPTSVHRLRPSDIKVIATIGDSLSAGMSIYSKSIATIFIQYRGHSFTAGGAENLETHTTLPTILKKFNPDLKGYSTGISGPDGRNANFNVAVVGDRAEAMPEQAKKIVQRMKESRDVDFNKDWKIINLFIGGNDICDYCKFPERFTPQKYAQHIVEALDYFQDNVPRAFVNLIEVIDASAVNALKDQSLVCKALLKTFWCKCGANRPLEEVRQYAVSLQQVTQQILADPDRYNKKREDFTVVLQPFLRYTYPPKTANGTPDMRYFAPDCFHLSALGHAEAAIALWKNMLQPIGKKDTSWIPGAGVACPTLEHPYLATTKNSDVNNLFF